MSTPDTMNCISARRYMLEAGRGPRPVDETLQQFDTHIQHCPACRAFQEEQQRWQRLGRALGEGSPPAPAGLRQRLFNTLALERSHLAVSTRQRQTAVLVIGMTGLILLMAAAGYWLAAQQVPSSLTHTAAAVIEDHRREHQNQSLSSTNRKAVENWLAERVAVPIRVVEFDGGQVQGARLCFLNNQTGAVIRYQVAGQIVSYYVMPTGDRPYASEAAMRSEARHGYNLLMWHDRKLLHALVSTLPNSKLQNLASRCQEYGKSS